jgi:hypothetical protein
MVKKENHLMVAYTQKIITNKEDFFDLRGEWEELTASLNLDITLTWSWLYSWWDVFSEAHELFILNHYREGRLEVVAPFYIKSNTLLFLGTGENESDEICTEYLNIIGNTASYKNVEHQILVAIENIKYKIDTILFIDHLSNSNIENLINQLKKSYFISADRKTYTCPFVELPNNWVELAEKTKINSREQLNRKLRLLEKEGTVALETINLDRNPGQLFDRFLPLHQKRWESEGKPGNFSSKKFCEFHQKFIQLKSPEIEANTYFLKSNNIDIAARYCLTYRNRIYDYSVGLEPEYMPKTSPGLLILAKILNQSIENKIQYFDFFKGEKLGYKYKWTNNERIIKTTLLKKKWLPFLKYKTMALIINQLKLIRDTIKNTKNSQPNKTNEQ